MRQNQITLPTQDMAASLAFYRTLGFKVIVDAAPRYVRLLNPTDDSTLSLHHVQSPKSGEGAILYFELHDLDERVASLRAAGLEFEHGPVDQRWRWREARLLDPYGNVIILYYAGTDRVDPPWRVR